MPDRTADSMSDRMPEDVPDKMPEDMPDRMSSDIPDRMPQGMPDKVPEDLPDRMPDRMSEDMPHRMPEDMPEHMPQDMPGRMPEDMPDRMPDRMPEDMSDRMPEDLPVTTRINVMVGTTLSKIIVHAFEPCSDAPVTSHPQKLGSVCSFLLWLEDVIVPKSCKIQVSTQKYDIIVAKSRYQWIGLRENLQETIGFPMKYVVFLSLFPLTNPLKVSSTTLTFLVQCHQTTQGYLWEEEWPALSSCPVAHAFTASEVSRIRESRGESLVMLHKLGSGLSSGIMLVILVCYFYISGNICGIMLVVSC